MSHRTRKHSHTARNRLIKSNKTMQLRAVKKQNMALMKTLSRKPSSWRSAIKSNERMQLKAIRAQNMSLIRTLKRSGKGVSDVKKRMRIQLNADKRQNKALIKTVSRNPSSWRRAVKTRMNRQLRAVAAQSNAIMS